MSSLFGNLHIYEIVLLFLGAFMFLILCGAMVYFIVRKQELKILFRFFPIPIIMMAYPSIQEISIQNDKIALKKQQQEVIEHPENTEAKEQLEKTTQKLEKRLTTINDVQAVAEANLLLGKPERAIDLTAKTLLKSESSSETNADQSSKLETLKKINQVAKIQQEIEIEQDSGVSKYTDKLKEKIDNVNWDTPKLGTFLRERINKLKR